MLRLLLMLLIFACKQQPQGNPDPCAHYPGSICPGQRHPSGIGNQNKSREEKQDEKQDEKDKEGTNVQQTETDDNKEDDKHKEKYKEKDKEKDKENDREEDKDKKKEEEEENDREEEKEDSDSTEVDNTEMQEVKLSELKVYAYVSQEQMAKASEQEQQLPSNEQGYTVGIYLSAWQQLDEKIRKQIADTLVLAYGEIDFGWDIGNALNIKVPLRLSFTADKKKHCWRVELSKKNFIRALHKDDFTNDDDNNRIGLRQISEVRDKMQAMTHSIGDCQ